MALSDPLGDMLTRIRNGQSAKMAAIHSPSSKLRRNVLEVLKREGYIRDFDEEAEVNGSANLRIELKYHDGRPVIDRIERISRPGLRIYRGKDELPKVLGGLGVAVVSTPQGIMSDKQARAAGTGGEVLFVVQ